MTLSSERINRFNGIMHRSLLLRRAQHLAVNNLN